MNEMSKFQRSWELLKSSVLIIARNKKLLVFPIVIGVCTLVIALFFVAPVVLRPTGYSYARAEHWQAIGHSLFTGSDEVQVTFSATNPVVAKDHSQLQFAESADAPGGHRSQLGLTRGALAYLVFLYFVSMFVATFFNVAFYNEILAALRGQPVSIGRGLRFAATKWKAILMWSLFAGLVGLIIKAIEQKLEVVGRFIARLLGLAWSVAAIFVIPVLVREEQSVNPVNMLRKSAGILKRTWGEALIGYVGLTFGNALIAVGSVVLLGGALAVSIVLTNFWIMAATALFWLLAVVAWAYVTNVASQVYKGALYLYAAEGVVPEPYTQPMLDSAWKFKKG